MSKLCITCEQPINQFDSWGKRFSPVQYAARIYCSIACRGKEAAKYSPRIETPDRHCVKCGALLIRKQYGDGKGNIRTEPHNKFVRRVSCGHKCEERSSK